MAGLSMAAHTHLNPDLAVAQLACARQPCGLSLRMHRVTRLAPLCLSCVHGLSPWLGERRKPVNAPNLPHHRLIAYSVAKELLVAVVHANIRDAELRDQATRAAKSAVLNTAE